MIGKAVTKLRHRLFTKVLSHTTSGLSILISVVTLSIVSCEDVIDVELNSTEPRIVIEGKIGERGSQYSVTISKTGDYFEPSTFPRVSGAFVKIYCEYGNQGTLFEQEELGLYMNSSFRSLPGRFRRLRVEVDGEVYTATSTMPYPIGISRLAYEYNEGGGFYDEGYVLFCYFNDPVGRDDYCRLVVERNGEDIDDYKMYDGKWSDGKEVRFDWGGFDLGDELVVKLFTLDEPVYDYFVTLANVVASDVSSESGSSPANPNSNLSNGALGYFSAYTVRKAIIVIEE